jgi:hypothetical protein
MTHRIARRTRRIGKDASRGVLVLLCLATIGASAQDARDSVFTVVVSLGGGYGRSLGAVAPPPSGGEYSAGGPGASLRVMWHPDHLLMAGVETGYLRISTLTLTSDTAADRDVSLNAVPMLAVFTMRKYGIELSGGLGVYRYSVLAESGRTGLRSGSYSIEIGYMASVGYAIPVSRRFDLGADLKAHFLPDRDIASILAQLRVSWRLFEY